MTVLASELIREAERLIDMRIHPQTIIAGYRYVNRWIDTASFTSILYI